MASEFFAALEDFQVRIAALPAAPVSREVRQEAIALGSIFFNDLRPQLAKRLGETEDLRSVDSIVHALIRLGHSKARPFALSQVCKGLHAKAVDLAVQNISAGSDTPMVHLSRAESILSDTLTKILPGAGASYRQAIVDIADESRESYRGPANELRECLREVVSHLAPDADVMAVAGFKLEDDQRKPTTKQKVRYILTNRKTNSTKREATEKSLDLIDELVGSVTRAVQTRANAAAHVGQSRKEAGNLKRYVDAVLGDLLEV